MQTQQIFTSATGSLFFGTVNKNSSEKSVDNTFEQMFRKTSEKLDKNLTADTDSTKVENLKTKDYTETKHSMEQDSVNTEWKDSTEQVSKTEQPGNTDEKELAERAAELVAQVTELVKDILNLSTEQLHETMDLLGMTEVDLLNADMLKQMVLHVNGEQDASAFLMNAELLSKMMQLTNEVEVLLAESGLSQEELMGMLGDDKFSELFQNAVDELSNQTDTDALSEQDKNVQTETVAKETQISFKTEVSVKETGVDAGRTDRNAEDGKELMQGETQFSGQFIQNLQKAFTEGVTDAALKSDLAAQIREIADQILEQVKVMVTPEISTLEVQLTPDELGKVTISVTEQDGVMKASIVTENELAKEAIESNLIQFKEMLQEQGLRVESVEVTVSEFTFDKNGETGQSSQEEKKQGKTHITLEEENNPTTMQDELALHFMEGGESTVNYMA